MTKRQDTPRNRARRLQDAVATVAEADVRQLEALRADTAMRLFHAQLRLEVIDTMILEQATRPEGAVT